MPEAPALVLAIDGRPAKEGAREFEDAVKRIVGAGKDIDGTVKKIDKSVKDSATSIGGSGKKTEVAIERISGSFSRFRNEALSLRGVMASLGVSIGAVSIATASVRAFSELEKGLVGVAKTANLTAQETEQLKDRIADIAQVVPVTGAELLSIAQVAGQLGVKGVDDLSLFTETVGKMGTASDLAGEEAATAMARILNVVKRPISEIDKLAAAIVGLGNNFAATEKEIAHMTTRLAQETSAFGTTAADVAGLGTAMKAFGITAERGGTAISKSFAAIGLAIKEGGEALETLVKLTGRSAEDLKRAFDQDAFSVFEDWVIGLDKAKLSSTEFITVMDQFDLKATEQQNVIAVLKNNINVFRDAIKLSNDEYQKATALNIEAAKAAETFSSQMTFLGNAVNSTAAELGRVLVPELLKVTSSVNEFLVEARKTGELEGIFRAIGNAVGVLADNLDLIVKGGSLLAILKMTKAFGPYVQAAAVAAAAIYDVSTNLTTSEKAADTFTQQIRKGEAALWDFVSATDAQSRAAASTAYESQIRDLEKLIDTSEKYIETYREQENFLGGATSSKDSLEIRQRIEAVKAMRGQLEDLKRARYESLPANLYGFQAQGTELKNVDEEPRLDLGSATMGGSSSKSSKLSASEKQALIDLKKAEEERIERLSKMTVREKSLRDQMKEAQELTIKQTEAEMARGRAIGAEVIPPLERYKKSVAEVNDLLKNKYITEAEAAAKLELLDDEYAKLVISSNDWGQAMKAAGDEVATAFEDAVFGGENLRTVIYSLIKDLGRLALRMATTKLIQSATSSLIGGLSGGTGDASAGVTASHGGLIKGYTEGGPVSGVGTQTSDSIPIRVSNREFVVNAAATKMFYPEIKAMNDAGRRKMRTGGVVSRYPGYALGGLVSNNAKTDAGGSRPVNWTVTNNIKVENQGNPGDRVSNDKLAKSVGESIKQSVRQVVLETLANESRGGGMLNPGVSMK